MTYDLHPRNRGLDQFRAGAFSWCWLLDQGVGWPLGYYAGDSPGTYLYTPDPSQRGDPATNDGYRVTAAQAREMARLSRYIVALHRARRQQWEALSEEERQRRQRWCRDHPLDRPMYRLPVREDFVDLAERFADWAERSGGFRID